MSGAVNAVGILGTGAWGSALAGVLQAAGHRVIARSGRAPEAVEALAADSLWLAMPTQHARAVLLRLAPEVPRELPVVQTAKGLELPVGLTADRMIREALPQAVPALFSGPAFAIDLCAGRPAALTLACADASVRLRLQALFAQTPLRIYPSQDLIGTALGGALKNVIALACGMAAGLGLGESAGAGLAARGFVEIRRLALACGADEETLLGPAGLGDLILTCGSTVSRNFTYGYALGAGMPLPSATAEGVPTAAAACLAAERAGVEMPIAAAVRDVLRGQLTPADAAAVLLKRPARPM